MRVWVRLLAVFKIEVGEDVAAPGHGWSKLYSASGDVD